MSCKVVFKFLACDSSYFIHTECAPKDVPSVSVIH